MYYLELSCPIWYESELPQGRERMSYRHGVQTIKRITLKTYKLKKKR